jgi:hypothetical protein
MSGLEGFHARGHDAVIANLNIVLGRVDFEIRLDASPDEFAAVGVHVFDRDDTEIPAPWQGHAQRVAGASRGSFPPRRARPES